jgi:hypothetical protein
MFDGVASPLVVEGHPNRFTHYHNVDRMDIFPDFNEVTLRQDNKVTWFAGADTVLKLIKLYRINYSVFKITMVNSGEYKGIIVLEKDGVLKPFIGFASDDWDKALGSTYELLSNLFVRKHHNKIQYKWHHYGGITTNTTKLYNWLVRYDSIDTALEKTWLYLLFGLNVKDYIFRDGDYILFAVVETNLQFLRLNDIRTRNKSFALVLRIMKTFLQKNSIIDTYSMKELVELIFQKFKTLKTPWFFATNSERFVYRLARREYDCKVDVNTGVIPILNRPFIRKEIFTPARVGDGLLLKMYYEGNLARNPAPYVQLAILASEKLAGDVTVKNITTTVKLIIQDMLSVRTQRNMEVTRMHTTVENDRLKRIESAMKMFHTYGEAQADRFQQYANAVEDITLHSLQLLQINLDTIRDTYRFNEDILNIPANMRDRVIEDAVLVCGQINVLRRRIEEIKDTRDFILKQ